MSTKSIRNTVIGRNSTANSQTPTPPVITGYSISGLDDTALDPAGGQTILVNGRGFLRGATVTLNGTAIGVVTWVSANQLSFTSPVNTAGTYQIYVVNVDGGTAIYLPGIVYSAFPTWTTSAGTLGSVYETNSINNTVVATGDAPITYSLYSGTLPTGASISSSGVITGTAPVDSGSTTYTFTIKADDAQKQSSTRTFSLTINTDVLTWVTPSSGATINLDGTSYSQALSATDAAGYSVSYTANALPTGLTLSSGTISGTPTVEGSTTTLLTATAATTTRSATNTITWVVSMSDAFWKYATLLLSANASTQTNSFVSDASINNTQLTVVGDTRAQNFHPYQPGYYSYQFGSSNYISVPSQNLYSTDFTIEAWINTTGGATQAIATTYNVNGTQAGTFIFGINSSNKIALQNNITGFTGTTTIIPGQWYHVAYTYKSSTTTMTAYLNGVQEASGSAPVTASSGTMWFGGSPGDNNIGGWWFLGYMSNLRVTKYLVYTGNFTPPTTPLLPVVGTCVLTAQSNKFIDSSSVNNTVTVSSVKTSSANPFTTQYQISTPYYSTYFNGSTDYLSIPASTPLNLTSGDFTIECWFYISTGGKTNTIFNKDGTSGTSYPQYEIYTNASNILVVNLGNGNGTSPTTTDYGSSTAVSINAWHHIAVQRTSTTISVYLDGARITNTSQGTTMYEGNKALMIGHQTGAASDYFSGHVSNLRITKGVALYSGTSISPSTTLLTTTSQGATAPQVSLLTCQSNTFVDNSTNNATITAGTITVKPLAVSPFVPAYYSNLFNGSTDYLTTSYNSAFDFASGDFTIECWINPAAISTNRVFLSTQSSGSSSAGWSCFLFSSGYIGFDVYEGSEKYVTSSTTLLTVGNWYHIAFARQSGTLRIFVNGVSQTFSGSQATNVNSAVGLTIGRQQQAGYDYSFAGYISNVRVVKGTSLYNSAFTPSTSPLTAVAGTSALTCQSPYFIDGSTNALAITQNGTPKIAAVAPFTQPTGYSGTAVSTTYGSGYFDGTGDYLTLNQPSLNFGASTDFTIEAWVYPTSTTNDWFIISATGSGGLFFGYTNTTTVGWGYGRNAVAWDYKSGSAVVANTWTHIAFTRSGTSLRLFANGVQIGTTQTSSQAYDLTTTSTTIGSQGTNYYLSGYITDLRIVKGTALYTSNFVPGFTSSLANVTNTQLLTLQTNGSHNTNVIKDSSSFNNVITRYGDSNVGTFSPYGDNWSYYTVTGGYYIAFTGTNILPTGTENFTVELWFNYVSYEASSQLLSTFGTTSGFNLWFNTSAGTIRLSSFGAVPVIEYSYSTLKAGTWYHLAVTRSGNNFTMYLNGTSVATATVVVTFADPGSSTIGAYGYTGYFSNIRVIRGTAIAPPAGGPTSPLTYVAGTSFLTAQSNKFIDNSPNNVTLTPQSSAVTIQKFSPFGSVTVSKNYSGYTASTANYWSVTPLATAFPSSGSSWTVEGWFYFTSFAAQVGLANVGDLFGWYIPSGGTTIKGDHRNSSGGGTWASASATYTFSINTWYHLALVNNNNSLQHYINGTAVGTATATAASANGGTGAAALWIGVNDNYTFNSPDDPLKGCVTNFRTCSIAVYTGNFTVPTTQLTVTQSAGTNISAITTGQCKLLTFTSNTVFDASGNCTIAQVGAPVILTASPFTPTISGKLSYSPTTFGGSIYYDGTGDYLQATVIAPGTLDFTIEGWVYFTSVTTGAPNIFSIVASGSSTGFQVHGSSSGWGVRSNTVNIISATGTVTANTWYHVAFVRKSGTSTLYINGVYLGSTASAYTFSDTQFNTGYTPIGQTMIGYVSDIRYTPGVALYTSNFYPNSAPLTSTPSLGSATYNSSLLLTGTGGGVVDATRTVDLETVGDAKVTPFSPYNGSYYSVQFNGSSDFINLPSASTSFAVGTGAMTIEAWFYLTTSSAWQGIASTTPTTTGVGMGVYVTNTNYVRFSVGNGSAGTDVNSSSTVSTGQWYHVAGVRTAGGAMTLYLNGTSVGTGTSSASMTSQYVILGRIYTDSAVNYLQGYISNVRVSNTARTISLPSTPYSSDANTLLLVCQSNKFVDNGANALTLSLGNAPKVQTQNPFQVNTGISYYFDGNGDSLTAQYTGQGDFGTGDFTIEFWMNTTTSGTFVAVVGTQSIAGYATAGMWRVSTRLNSVNGLYFNYTNGSAFTDVTLTTTNYNDNAWHHVAVTRTSNTLRGFIDGNQVGSTTVTQNLTSGKQIYVGYQPQDGSYYTGYITDLRITKGYARTITVPTQPVKTN